MGETREEASFMDIVQSLERGCGEERKLGRFWWWEGENGSISGHKLSLLCPLKEENEDGNYFYFWFTFWFFEFINSTVRLVQIGYRLQCTLHVKFKQIGLVVGKKKKKKIYHHAYIRVFPPNSIRFWKKIKKNILNCKLLKY